MDDNELVDNERRRGHELRMARTIGVTVVAAIAMLGFVLALGNALASCP